MSRPIAPRTVAAEGEGGAAAAATTDPAPAAAGVAPATTDPAPAVAGVAGVAGVVGPGRRGRVALSVAAAVDEVFGVRRYGGQRVEVATHYPGGRVVGVSLLDQATVGVHIVAERLPLGDLAEAVGDAARVALRACADDREVTVYIDDLDVERLPPRPATRRPSGLDGGSP